MRLEGGGLGMRLESVLGMRLEGGGLGMRLGGGELGETRRQRAGNETRRCTGNETRRQRAGNETRRWTGNETRR